MQNPEKEIVSHVITAMALCVVAFCFLLDARFQVGASHEVLKYIASASAGIAVTSFIATVVNYRQVRAFIVGLVIFAVFLLMFWGADVMLDALEDGKDSAPVRFLAAAVIMFFLTLCSVGIIWAGRWFIRRLGV